MNSFLRNTISKLYNAVSEHEMHMQKDCRAYVKLLFLLYNRVMESMKYGPERLKDIREKQAEEEAKE